MKSMSLKRKIQVSFTLMLALIAVIGFVAYQSMGSIESRLEEISGKRLPALDMLIQADRDLQQLLVAERSLMYPDLPEKYVAQFIKDFKANMDQAIQRFRKYTSYSPSDEEKKYIQIFEDKYSIWSKESTKLIELRAATDINIVEEARSKSLDEVSVLFEEMRDQLDKLQDLNNERAAKDREEAMKIYEYTVSVFVALIALGSICAFGLGRFLTKTISVPLTHLNDIVNNTNGVIKRSSEAMEQVSTQLSDGMGEQSSSVEETSASLVELKEMVGSNLSNAKQASEQANKMREISRSGIETMNSVQSAMDDLKVGNEEIKALVEVIANIGEKTKIMDEIVFQTKLLSFNASVEAERAGEHGRGFAVVAQEVGNLASLSGKAALEIADIVGKSIGKAESITKNNKEKVDVGVQSVAGAIAVFNQVTEAATSVSDNAHQVLIASQEQLKGVEQINQAVIQIDQLTHTNTQMAVKASDNSKELNEQVEMMESVTQEISSIVYGA